MVSKKSMSGVSKVNKTCPNMPKRKATGWSKLKVDGKDMLVKTCCRGCAVDIEEKLKAGKMKKKDLVLRPLSDAKKLVDAGENVRDIKVGGSPCCGGDKSPRRRTKKVSAKKCGGCGCSGKKRISQEEYNKKNKTRKNKKMIGGAGEPIEQSDIMYQDDLVCILKPDVKKGIIIWTHYTQPPEMDSLCKSGLKTGQKLNEEGVNFGRSIIHPYIFFRAPFYSKDIDYTSVETEIISSYGEGQIGREPRAFIRVDPDKTFVFSSEIRVLKPTDIEQSKKTLSEYLRIIYMNSTIYKTLFPLSKTKKQPAYNLISSELIPIENNGIQVTKLNYPLINIPIERNSEILVSIPHLTPEYFVLCTS